MIPYPQIDPTIFRLWKLEVRWYGMMYVLGFLATFSLVKYQVKKFGNRYLEPHLDNLNMVLILSLILGARFGYVIFYNPAYYLNHPLEILATWHGGMSFHGGLIGVVLGGILFCSIKKIPFLQTADLYVVTLPIGLGLGRLGNFINGELYGRVADVPWAMIFPDGGPDPRHPSQLYEAFLEGALLFTLLWILKNKRWPAGAMLSLFLLFYGIFRILAEFFREPDAHIGFLFNAITMGQLLSIMMILCGAALLVMVFKKQGGMTSGG